MTIEQVEIQLIASVVAAACALPGVFLILRRTAQHCLKTSDFVAICLLSWHANIYLITLCVALILSCSASSHVVGRWR